VAGRRIAVALARRDRDAVYDVLIRPGSLRQVGRIIADAAPAHQHAVVSDENVAGLYGQPVVEGMTAAGLRPRLFTFSPGEASKTRETWAALSDELQGAGLGRDGAVVALGGGVVGDLAGFVAATYMRGLPLVQLPTTLLAMLDSSVGGKNAVDTRAAKNLIGSFHQPRLVLIDPEVLRTLPDRHVIAGLAEAYKHAAILDEGYFSWLEGNVGALRQRRSSVLEELVGRSVEIKAGVVATDELETGYRQVLNFGHTVGHAIEAAAGYGILHGEAIAIGMVAEAAIGERLGVTREGVTQRLLAALEAAGLPTSLAGERVERRRFIAALGADKKRAAGGSRLVLLRGVGELEGSEDRGWSRWVGQDVIVDAVFGGVGWV
jgi:3-dehydroquinate synthase